MRRYITAILSADDIAREMIWRWGSTEHTSIEPASWELSPKLNSELQVLWPARYHWLPAKLWLYHLEVAFKRLSILRRTGLHQAQYGDGCVMLEIVRRGATHRVAIDYSDYMDEISEAALSESVVYFKMQYRRDGYGIAKIIPGGYPSAWPDAYRFLSRLRRACDDQKKLYNIYGRFGLAYSTDIRRRALAILGATPDLDFHGGTAFVRFSRYLREIARARVGVDLPGNGDLCFRLVDYLSIGLCVIGPQPRAELPVPLIDRHNIVYCKPDLSDLALQCRYYLENDAERQRIAHNARVYFDRYLHRDQLARYYLSKIVAATA